MGNKLCKERIERAENSKNPVDRVIGRCAQICPSSFGTNESNSNYWKNNILETGPPATHQPKANTNEWRAATLNTVSKPDLNMSKQTFISDIPIAPPRRKRNTLPRVQNGQPGGFKEVFGTPSRRSSCDSVQQINKATLKKQKNNISDIQSDDFADFSKDSPIGVSRKVSKVGNKKSDKLLGENLSSCLSNSPFLASTPILPKKAEDPSMVTVSKDAVKTIVNSNDSEHDLSLNISKILASQMEQPKISELSQTQSQIGPIEMHIQYSKETPENLDKRAEFLKTMVGHESSEATSPLSAQYREVLSAPKRRRSKNITKEESITDDKNATEMNNEIASEAIKKVVQVASNEPIDAEKFLKLDLSQKKKEFPKSNPDSPNIYSHLQPVEHELIVPVRKNYKHVCDDDHSHKLTAKHGHGHSHSHSHDHSSSVDGVDDVNSLLKVNEHKVQGGISPKKPERDFSRYRKSDDLSILEEPRADSWDSIIESQILRPERRKGKSISRDSLPSPPPRPVNLPIDRKISLQESTHAVKSRKISLQEPMRGLFEDQKLPDAPVTPMNTPILNDNEYEKIETFLKKCSSSQSFLTKELMDQLVDRVYGYSRNWDDQMEDGMLHTKCDDGSEKVGPSSKLTTRKISIIKTISPPIIIQENIEEVKKATFLIGTSDLQNEILSPSEKIVSPVEQIENSSVTNASSLIKRTDTVLELLPIGIAHGADVVESEEQSNPAEEGSSSDPDLDVVKVLLKSTEIHQGSETNALEDIYKKNQAIMDEFKDYLEDKKINEEMMKVANSTEVEIIIDEKIDKSHTLFPDHISLNSFDSHSNSDDDTDNKTLKNRLDIANEPRRGSIVEHDQWFLKHRDISNQGRRGSDCPTTYDTTKLFPFGKRDRNNSQSNEFFFSDDHKKSKSSDHVNMDVSNDLDHSTLLKYFNKND